MRWLLKLYPPAWQRRYRREMEAHLEVEPAGIRTALDLVAGAVDAWLNPEVIPAAAATEGEQIMITAARCESVAISRADAGRSAGWMIGTALVLTILGVTLDKTMGPHLAIDALLNSAFFIALTVSSRSTFLRPYSRTARNVLIGVGAVAWYAFFLAVGGLALT